jgi:serine/threonine protein kinase/cytochrome c-type biogenesis protein CcmH/NrfG
LKCPKCQHDNPENTKFCGECGASLGVDLGSLSPTRTMLGPVLHLKKGQKIAGKYKIIEKIGEGGMGIVYKAEDTKLKRNVALKFLPSELTRDKKAKTRFIQEAQAAAALNHPHICTVYEVDESDDQTFIAMEFIEGKTLKDKIEAGPLATDEAIDIASQVAEGLGEAHKKGIVHRDIKPANIMLTEKGQAKIMDFGLAKLSWGADLTKPSMIMGTVAYMSPQQARGEPVDHRTDIWSLGAMLYEMLTAVKPFQKSHEQALIHSILNEEPSNVSAHRSDVPDYLEKVIEKALDKKVDRRFQTAEEMLQELKQSPPIIFPEPKKSIVVLPFENLSPDPDQEYFCDGMTEEIITDLSHIHDLLVISRSSAMTFKGTKSTIKEIADKVNVRYVLEGSVRKAGNNLRITAQLIDAKTDAHLWAEKYSGTLDYVFDIQEQVSRSIVDQLKLKLTPNESKQIAERPVEDIRAYNCYLQARRDIWICTEDSMARAHQQLKNGLDLIGDNPLLYSGLGYIYLQYIVLGLKPRNECLSKAEEYVKKIFELEPGSIHGHRLTGLIQYQRGNMQEVVKHMQKVLAVDPNDPDVLHYLPHVYCIVGKTRMADPLVKRLVEIDPLTPMNHWGTAWLPLMEGHFDQALKSFKKMYQLDPKNPVFQYYYALTNAYNQNFGEAYSIIERSVKDSPNNLMNSTMLFLKNALKGKKSDAINALTQEFTDVAAKNEEGSWSMAVCYALIDEKDKSLDWLENAIDRGFINYQFFNEYDPFLERIRKEPRFKRLMDRVKYEAENFEV